MLRTNPSPDQAPPLSSWFDWLLLVAWGVAVVYLVITLRRPQAAYGVFMLPLVLVLIAVASLFRHAEPFPRGQALYVWGIVHGVALMLGSVVVMLGFIAGVMYLVQSYPSEEETAAAARVQVAQPGMAAAGHQTRPVVFVGIAGGRLAGGRGAEPGQASGRHALDRSRGLDVGHPVRVADRGAGVRVGVQARPAGPQGGLSDLGEFRVPGAGPGHGAVRPVAACQSAVQRPVAVLFGLRRPAGAWGDAMKLQMVGCSHHTAAVEVRERLAFSGDQTRLALAELRQRFPDVESVLLSTCNRVELYAAAEDPADVSDASPAGRVPGRVSPSGRRWRSSTPCSSGPARTPCGTCSPSPPSLDSMVVGEAQILSQVKQAYELARTTNNAGPLTNAAFQAAMRVAKRVANETAINQRRVSIPSVAVADFASQIFERFDDKQVLVIGAGEMGEETVRYLIDEGVREITVVNRTCERAPRAGRRIGGRRPAVGRAAPVRWPRPTW